MPTVYINEKNLSSHNCIDNQPDVEPNMGENLRMLTFKSGRKVFGKYVKVDYMYIFWKNTRIVENWPCRFSFQEAL